MFEIA
jgi:hypothetical protein